MSRGSPFNNDDMPFYLLAIYLAPATIYFKNGNNLRDPQLWVNVILYFPIIFSLFGHLLAVAHAWWFIYRTSDITGAESSYIHHLSMRDDGLDVEYDSDNEERVINIPQRSAGGFADEPVTLESQPPVPPKDNTK